MESGKGLQPSEARPHASSLLYGPRVETPVVSERRQRLRGARVQMELARLRKAAQLAERCQHSLAEASTDCAEVRQDIQAVKERLASLADDTSALAASFRSVRARQQAIRDAERQLQALREENNEAEDERRVAADRSREATRTYRSRLSQTRALITDAALEGLFGEHPTMLQLSPPD